MAKDQAGREPACQISIRYFFVKDRIKSKEVFIEQHCPMVIMTPGLFTKPLQGSLFHKFRDEVMNIK
jgi:hypothetical protein